MSHEILTPMNAILGFTELILNNTLGSSEQTRYLEKIQSSGKNLLSLINDILVLSKIEANRLEIQPEPVNIRKVLNDVRNLFLYKSQEKGLELRTDTCKQVPERLLLDEVRIRQILTNLVGNAIKFTSQGFVKVYVKLSEPSGTQETSVSSVSCPQLLESVKNSHPEGMHIRSGGHFEKHPGPQGGNSPDSPDWGDSPGCRSARADLEFEIEDTGVGISHDQQKLIFEYFRQLDGRKNRKYEGTGLGLAITRRLAEMMNGKISVKSSIGKGSTFRLIIPDIEVLEESAPAKNTGSDEIHQETEETAFVQSLSSEIAGQLSELTKTLESEFMQKWEDIREALIFDEVGDFARQVRENGEIYNYAPLLNWCERLISQMQDFDIKALDNTFGKFPEIIEQLQKIAK